MKIITLKHAPVALCGHMLHGGDFMLNSKQHLENLIKWGDDVIHLLQQRSVSNPEINTKINNLIDWQQHIRKLLNQEIESLEFSEILELQTKGELLISDINQMRDERQEPMSVPFGKHQLPPLPYAYNALEPYISEEIMRLHHDKHHQSYVDGLNKAELALYKSNSPLKHWLREQAFHGSGHYLHTIFWENMTPNSTKKPAGELLKQIEKDFGSWRNFKELFSNVANSVEGVGWAILLWQPRSRRLGIQSFEKHQLFQIADTIPLLVLDMWEHAYYLQYKTDKKAYIDNWWNVVNWNNVNNRYQKAKELKWQAF